mmetsp:Transcript_92082/g.183460  ORF Transcript_92082/g.183460 Transcript_92082/m.183460 type:complete len:160 (+) Transcript_92082:103-582(+)
MTNLPPKNLVLLAAGACVGALLLLKRTHSKKVRIECKACENPNTEKLSNESVEIEVSKRGLWTLSSDKTRIIRNIVCKNFQCALDYLAEVGAVAEAHSHHPDLHLENYRVIRLEIYTHSQGGLTEYDFTLADAIDAVHVSYSPKFLREQNARLEATTRS